MVTSVCAGSSSTTLAGSTGCDVGSFFAGRTSKGMFGIAGTIGVALLIERLVVFGIVGLGWIVEEGVVG